MHGQKEMILLDHAGAVARGDLVQTGPGARGAGRDGAPAGRQMWDAIEDDESRRGPTGTLPRLAPSLSPRTIRRVIKGCGESCPHQPAGDPHVLGQPFSVTAIPPLQRLLGHDQLTTTEILHESLPRGCHRRMPRRGADERRRPMMRLWG